MSSTDSSNPAQDYPGPSPLGPVNDDPMQKDKWIIDGLRQRLIDELHAGKDSSYTRQMLMFAIMNYHYDGCSQAADVQKKIQEIVSNNDGGPITYTYTYHDPGGDTSKDRNITINIPAGCGLTQLQNILNMAADPSLFPPIGTDANKPNAGDKSSSWNDWTPAQQNAWHSNVMERQKFAQFFQSKVQELKTKLDKTDFGPGADSQISTLKAQCDELNKLPTLAQDGIPDPAGGGDAMDLTALYERSNPGSNGTTWYFQGTSVIKDKALVPDPQLMTQMTTDMSVANSQMQSFSAMGEQNLKYAVSTANTDVGAFNTLCREWIANEKTMVGNQRSS
ncbi:MAG: hypothetical protein S4CHLAM102_04760 [Chlamydiia bacterium]|nr:hypothetical protein [Chlamydiia bacterium]